MEGSLWMPVVLAAQGGPTAGPDDLYTYLVLGALLFACGVFTLISRRNAVGLLMGVELILNAAGVNFAAFSRFNGHPLDGQVFVLFIVVLAAAEAAVALALVLAVFQTRRAIEMDEMTMLKR